MMFSALGSASSGENAKYGRSHWQKSVGEVVASDCLNVVDDPS